MASLGSGGRLSPWHAAECLKELLWQVLDREAEMPNWLVKGRTVLLPKTTEWGPGLYR